MEDVWSPGEDGSQPEAAEYGEGLWMTQAFSVDGVVKNGFAILKEHPAYTVVAALLLWVLGFLPSVLNSVLQVIGVVQQVEFELGQPPPTMAPEEALLNLAGQMGVLALQLVLFPFMLLLTAGMLRGFAWLVEDGAEDWRRLFTSFMPALKLFAYGLIFYLILTVFSVACAIPSVIGGIVVGLASIEAGVLVGVILYCALLLVGMVYLSITFFPGMLAVTVDERGPIESLGITWRAAQGARATLLVMFLVYGLILAIPIAGIVVVQFMVGPLAGLVANVAVSPLTIALSVVFTGGWAAGWLLYARPEARTREWDFFQRHPQRWS